MNDAAIRFSHAITRRPAASCVDGLRAVDTGAPDFARMTRDHADYVAALEAAGCTVIVLPPLEAFPDAQFVEDTALLLPEGAVLMRPGAASRRGEVAQMAPALAPFYGDLPAIEPPGHVEAGDILWTGREVLVGLSARTDAAGVAALGAILAGWGVALRVLDTPPGVLHFKTDCSLLDPETVLATTRLAAAGGFSGYRVLPVPEGEEAAANTIRVNDFVLMAAGFPRTAERLDKAGYRVVELPNAECARIDGGMSCLSLRFTPPTR
jgi:dimethylargininase